MNEKKLEVVNKHLELVVTTLFILGMRAIENKPQREMQTMLERCDVVLQGLQIQCDTDFAKCLWRMLSLHNTTVSPIDKENKRHALAGMLIVSLCYAKGKHWALAETVTELSDIFPELIDWVKLW